MRGGHHPPQTVFAAEVFGNDQTVFIGGVLLFFHHQTADPSAVGKPGEAAFLPAVGDPEKVHLHAGDGIARGGVGHQPELAVFEIFFDQRQAPDPQADRVGIAVPGLGDDQISPGLLTGERDLYSFEPMLRIGRKRGLPLGDCLAEVFLFRFRLVHQPPADTLDIGRNTLVLDLVGILPLMGTEIVLDIRDQFGDFHGIGGETNRLGIAVFPDQSGGGAGGFGLDRLERPPIADDLLHWAATEGLAKTAANIGGVETAAKTGTTNYSEDDIRRLGLRYNAIGDLWVCGYTPSQTITYWYGYDKITSEYHNTTATWTIRDTFYRNLAENLFDRTGESFPIPSSVVKVGVVRGSIPLKLANEYTPADNVVYGYFDVENVPKEEDINYSSLPNVSNFSGKMNGNKVTLTWSGISADSLFNVYFEDSFGSDGYDIYF